VVPLTGVRDAFASSLGTVSRVVATNSMAVVAGVLHNVGNVLNSVNVSAILLRDRLSSSKTSGVGRLADLPEQHAGDLDVYLSLDARGRMIPGYLRAPGDTLAAEQADLLGEIDLPVKNVDHIKQIVAMRQSHAKVAGVVEVVDNGIGIGRENLTRIFSHGFTTRKDGHGFGLHSGALAAREMGGSLTASSLGPGCGARFTLELPVTAEVPA